MCIHLQRFGGGVKLAAVAYAIPAPHTAAIRLAVVSRQHRRGPTDECVRAAPTKAWIMRLPPYSPLGVAEERPHGSPRASLPSV